MCRALPPYKVLPLGIAIAGREQDGPSQHAMPRLRRRFIMKQSLSCLTAVPAADSLRPDPDGSDRSSDAWTQYVVLAVPE